MCVCAYVFSQYIYIFSQIWFDVFVHSFLGHVIFVLVTWPLSHLDSSSIKRDIIIITLPYSFHSFLPTIPFLQIFMAITLNVFSILSASYIFLKLVNYMYIIIFIKILHVTIIFLGILIMIKMWYKNKIQMPLYAKLRRNSWHTFMFSIKKHIFMCITKRWIVTEGTHFSNYIKFVS